MLANGQFSVFHSSMFLKPHISNTESAMRLWSASCPIESIEQDLRFDLSIKSQVLFVWLVGPRHLGEFHFNDWRLGGVLEQSWQHPFLAKHFCRDLGSGWVADSSPCLIYCISEAYLSLQPSLVDLMRFCLKIRGSVVKSIGFILKWIMLHRHPALRLHVLLFAW